MLNNLLIYRLALFNGICIAVLLGSAYYGLPQLALGNDGTYITHSIVVLFFVGILSVFRKGWQISRRINIAKVNPTAALVAALGGGKLGYQALLDKEKAKIKHIEQICLWLVGLGLFGTVVGFLMALATTNLEGAGTAEGAAAAITQLRAGMYTALYTTAVGFVFGLWLEANYLMINTALQLLISDIVMKGNPNK